MTDREINRATINVFMVRAIGHAAAVAIDAESACAFVTSRQPTSATK